MIYDYQEGLEGLAQQMIGWCDAICIFAHITLQIIIIAAGDNDARTIEHADKT